MKQGIAIFSVLTMAALASAGCSVGINDGTSTSCVASFAPSETAGGEIKLEGTNSPWVAMPFVISTSSAPANVKLKLKALGSPTGSLVVEIQADSGSKPSNIALEDATIAASTVSATSSASYDFVFPTPVDTLAAGTYWIVLRGTTLTPTDAIYWMGNDQGLYSGGSPLQTFNGGSTWLSGGIQSGRYFLFLLGC